MSTPPPIPPSTGRVVMCSPDPDAGLIHLGLTTGELITLRDGTRAAVMLEPETLLILNPRTPEARTLTLPAPLAHALAHSFPLAQSIREGLGAHHDA